MSDYLLMLRFDIKKLMNYVVEIRRTPKKLISYFLYVAWIILIFAPQFQKQKNSSLEFNPAIIKLVLGGYTLLIGTLIFFALFSALKKLSYAFKMGDVNLLFPSPIEPQRILFWSMFKKIPASLAIVILPTIFLTPTLFNLGLQIQGVMYIYLSLVSLALLLSPLGFLVFLLAVRYQKEQWVRGVLVFSVIWLIGSWLWQVRGDFATLNMLTGYLAGGVWQFPVIGWICQIAYAGFFGAGHSTFLAILGVILAMILVNITLYRLAKDYYEDVLEHSETLEKTRRSAKSGRPQFSEALSTFRKKSVVLVQGSYSGSKAFLFKQIVKYRPVGFNEYFGYLALLALVVGLGLGFFVNRIGGVEASVGLYIMNGIITYSLVLTSSVSVLSTELSLPYIYVLPGSFYNKVLAIIVLPVIRFAMNIVLLNLSYILMVKGDTSAIISAVVISVVVVSIFFEMSQTTILSHVLLPSSLDRKLFYPLQIFIQLIILAIPAVIVGGIFFLIFGTEVAVALGIVIANVGVGMLLLYFAEKLFSYIEMQEFNES